jgi:hypothetical protein
MSNERFTLTPCANMMWRVDDKQTGFSIDFREGLFYETQEVSTPANLTEEQIKSAATTMREMGDWLAHAAREVVICDTAARCRAIWTLANERYWLAMADALNGVLIDWDDDETAARLFDEMDDYTNDTTAINLTEAETENLMGALSMLSNSEAREVINLVYVFWQYCGNKDVSIWAHDLLWWPAWCPDELKYNEETEEE